LANQNEGSQAGVKGFLSIAAIAIGAISIALLSINVSLAAKWNDTLCNVSHLLGLISIVAGLLGLLLLGKGTGISQKVIWIGVMFGIVTVICHLLVWIRNFLLFMISVQ
jgi:hypothetical protein